MCNFIVSRSEFYQNENLGGNTQITLATTRINKLMSTPQTGQISKTQYILIVSHENPHLTVELKYQHLMIR